MSLTHNRMVANILDVYDTSTRDERLRGAQWYPLAHNIVLEWADTFERSIANVACIVAAISPQVEWTRNLIIADDILRGYPPSISSAIQRNLRIAEAIRDANATSLDGYFFVGCKVRSFAANLAGNFDVVTVDTHAAQIAAGDPRANLRVGTWKQYEPVASAYVMAARELRVEPSTLQATTWLTWKRMYPPEQKRVIRRKDR